MNFNFRYQEKPYGTGRHVARSLFIRRVGDFNFAADQTQPGEYSN
ncbi:MAG TPA: hypothetical protein VJM47_02790 [Nitrosospira sp.]|jgi:hypothetical protein|nr:hypothetical protein [Nitrosospira sp.]